MQHVCMQIAGGISGFKAERPRMLMVSSAAVERNAIIGDDAGWSPAGTASLYVGALRPVVHV